MIHRTLSPSKSNSYFLFGARGTGKTTLLRQLFTPEDALFIDLLDASEEDIFARDPSELEKRVLALPPKKEWVVLDEIQRVPRLLDSVHRLIETTGRRFVLTGSSGRKLSRGASNLLAGRAFVYRLFPFTSREIGDAFDLREALAWGMLPGVMQHSSPEDKARFLQAYSFTYLKEEIVAEQIIRKLDPFRRFLEIAAQSNGRIINFSNIAEDTRVDTKTVQSYFSILEETLIGTLLQPYHASVRKRQRANPKFYFFDTGVKRALERTLALPLQEGTYAYGEAFEHFIILELMRMSAYRNNDWEFSYLRTIGDAEIDLIIDRPGMPTAIIEIKPSATITERDCATLNRFAAEIPHCEPFCLSRDPHAKKIGAVQCLAWQEGIREIGV